MGLFDWFKKPQPIRHARDLEQFLDEQASFVAQKGIFEYSRARAGHYAKVLFGEQDFIDAVDRSRWQAYPLALAMVAELAEGLLRQHAGADVPQLPLAISDLALTAFDRHPVPAALGAVAWKAERDQLARRIKQVGLHPPKPARDIPIPLAQAYFDLMPIHPKLRGSEFPTITNYLRVTMCNVHDQLAERIDGPTLVGSMRGQPIE